MSKRFYLALFILTVLVGFTIGYCIARVNARGTLIWETPTVQVYPTLEPEIWDSINK